MYNNNIDFNDHEIPWVVNNIILQGRIGKVLIGFYWWVLCKNSCEEDCPLSKINTLLGSTGLLQCT